MRTRFYPAYERGRLHPEAETVLEEIRCAPGKPLVELTPTEARADFLPSGWLGVPEPCVIIQERSIPGPAGSIPLHVCGTGDGSYRPVLLFFHGGGFVLGALEEFDAFCTYLAKGAECIVVSVGYRLAPEHPFPAAVEDASAVLKWVASHAEELGGDPGRIAVAGDSAGGNLAAVVTLLARDEQHPKLALQVLICPWVDLTDGAEETESFR
jgi:acetyl esterase